MRKLTVAVLAVALAATASAAGWRDLRIDASSEASFTRSVELFQDKLSKSREHAFERALQDIWTQRTQDASAELYRSQAAPANTSLLGRVPGNGLALSPPGYGETSGSSLP